MDDRGKIMKIKEMTEEEILQAGMDALEEKLGPVGFIKFWQFFEEGTGNYTEERKEILKNYTSESIIEEIYAKRKDK